MKALVCFSGGQDSTTALGMALKQYQEVYTVGFEYHQRHDVEMACRQNILKTIQDVLGVNTLRDDLVIPLLSFAKISDCALTRDSPILMDVEKGLPTTFVPGRNLLFVTYAAAYAYRIGVHDIFLGVSETDYSGYPDCRDSALKPLETALTNGMDYEIRLKTPFMFCDKAKEWEIAEEIGGPEFVSFIAKETHTCYLGDHEHWHEWGYGCGLCPACTLRARGFEEYLENKKYREHKR